jgi:UDP-N-acetylglucosamine:LPS N-acetylglucosamine transferase
MSESTPKRKVDFLFFDAGGGHRSAANALREVIEREGRPWEIRLVNLQEMLEPLDVFRKITGLRLEDVYNLMLKKGWTLGSPQLTRGMHLMIRLYHRRQVRLIEEHWKRSRPDLVVSLIPNFNRAIFESLRNVWPETPMVTVLTDLADFPPHFWLEPQDQYVVCGTPKAVAQARAMGIRPEKIFRVSGMILNPRFYEPFTLDREAERRRLGLNPEMPTGLVLFGGQGSGIIEKIARKLDASGLDLQLILVCGRNEKLAARLRATQWRIPVHIEGFTAEVHRFMRLADFLIGKPGPGSISEALAMKLPVIVVSNAWTLPQERYNPEWIVENGVGEVVRNFRRIDEVVRDFLEPARFENYRANAARIENRALFEILEILSRLLGEPAPPATPDQTAGNNISST